MGCNDLQFMAPYLRSILYRRGWAEGRGRKVIIDVGANAGDDTVSIIKSFHPILQMCHMYSSPIQLVSVEPSPKVFCEMIEMVTSKLTEEDSRSKVLLNLALSEKTGHLIFADPGNEGGKLIGNNFTDLPQMTDEDFARYSKCKYSTGEFRNMTLDGNRRSTVPTYTLDLLVSSLEALSKIQRDEEIFVVKIDTEGARDMILQALAILILLFFVLTIMFLIDRISSFCRPRLQRSSWCEELAPEQTYYFHHFRSMVKSFCEIGCSAHVPV